ncbi:MAG: hypothetical protein M3319_08410 [Actinomycetota bacterium]|nr:hypothetical protein [Actinomycetota bacterium]MDQ3900449.1 hypothetical protein [Actinomycetota bacterium]
MITTTVDLLDAIHTHLADFELPAMWSVQVAASQLGPQVNVQLTHREPPEIAGALLTWADTLDAVTAESWRVPSGESVHLSITGRLPGDVSVRVYGCLPFHESGFGGDLSPGATITVPLHTLRHFSAIAEVTS